MLPSAIIIFTIAITTKLILLKIDRQIVTFAVPVRTRMAVAVNRGIAVQNLTFGLEQRFGISQGLAARALTIYAANVNRCESKPALSARFLHRRAAPALRAGRCGTVARGEARSRPVVYFVTGAWLLFYA